MRRLMLLLLSVFVISAVSAEEYFVVIDGYTQEQIQDVLNATSWDIYTPQITKIEDRIYFASEKDLARFLLPVKVDYDWYVDISKLQFVFPRDRIKPSIPFTLICGGLDNDAGTGNSNQNLYFTLNNDKALTSYIIANLKGYTRKYGGEGDGNFYVDNIMLPVEYQHRDEYGDRRWANYFDKYVLPTNCVLHWQVVESWDWEAYVCACVLVKGHVEGKFSGDHTENTDLYYYESAPFPLVIETAPNVNVFIDDVLVGKTNESGKLVAGKPVGVYNLKLVFNNGISVEKQVEITADDNNTLKINYGTVNIIVVDGLSGEALDDVKVSGNISENIDGTFTTSMPYGEYSLEFSKDGYWSENKTIEVDGDKNITVYLFPKTTIFKVSSPQQGVKLFPNSEVTFYLDIEPVKNTYRGLLYIDGITIKSVKDADSGIKLDYQNGAYVIGDLKEGETKRIKIDAETDDTIGDRAIQIRLKGNDVLGNEYTTDYQLRYTILELPVSIVVPSKWVIGKNLVKISELKGKDKVIFVQLYKNGTLIDSQSYAFNGWETHTFEININEVGEYTLKISAHDFSTNIKFKVVNPIQIVEKTITAPAGGEGAVKIEIYNPHTEPVYYKIKISGDCLANESVKDVSVAPGLTKTFEVPIKIVDNPEFDSYKLNVQVLDENGAVVEFEDSVICNIGEDSGFVLGLGDDGIFGIPILYIVGGLALLGGAFLLWRWF